MTGGPTTTRAPLSMTGAGSASVDTPAGRVDAEARSVNHRFLKVSAHVSSALAALEPEVETRVRARVERGHVTVSLRFTRSSSAAAAAFRVDASVAKAAAKRLRELAEAAGIDPEVTLRDLLSVPGVVGDAGAIELPPEVEAAASKALDLALESHRASRAREGVHLADECRAILARVARNAATMRARAPELPKLYRDRLAARITALLEGSGVAPDPASLAREVATFADRCDVAEELARLDAHLAHAASLLASDAAVGRKLDFLIQEFHREVNTLGSKSPDPEMTALVLDVKADVERLREQVQNFE